MKTNQSHRFFGACHCTNPCSIHKHLCSVIKKHPRTFFKKLHFHDFTQPLHHRVCGALIRDPRSKCKMLMKPDIRTIRRIHRVDHAPLRPVKHTRFGDLRTAIHRQVYFTKMREKRIVGQPIQVLDDPYPLRVVGRTPISFKRLLETVFNDAFAEEFLIVHLDETDEILLVFLRVFEIFAVHRETDMLLLKSVIFLEEVKNQRPTQLDTLETETVAVGR